ncbi:MAG: hypothetical protein MJZ37_09910 [Bacilli bacterium]|nr:hypothetical protein [Bacilli bacterium]
MGRKKRRKTNHKSKPDSKKLSPILFVPMSLIIGTILYLAVMFTDFLISGLRTGEWIWHWYVLEGQYRFSRKVVEVDSFFNVLIYPLVGFVILGLVYLMCWCITFVLAKLGLKTAQETLEKMRLFNK